MPNLRSYIDYTFSIRVNVSVTITCLLLGQAVQVCSLGHNTWACAGMSGKCLIQEVSIGGKWISTSKIVIKYLINQNLEILVFSVFVGNLLSF